MAKRQRKTEQDYLRARGALMRSIQRTNKAFGSNIKISDIVDVPTPAQAKKMSAAELRKMTRRIQSARTEKGQKMTFVPTGIGGVTKVPTKDYNAAMSNLGKRNKALRHRMSAIDSAIVPTRERARTVGVRKVKTWRGESKIMPTEELDPMTAFIGGNARGNVDEILKRFASRGEIYAKAQREWAKSDETMRKNFTRMMGIHDQELERLLKRLTNEQLLWAVYERNLPSEIEAAQYERTDPLFVQDRGSGLDQQRNDGIRMQAVENIREILTVASMVTFKESE